MTTLADVGLSENLPGGRHLFVRHRLWSPAGPGSSSGEYLLAWKRAALFHDLVTHRDDGLRRKRHRNKDADASSRWRREKKHPFSSVPQIGRFNWRPDRCRPVIVFSSSAVPASVDVRRAPLRSPVLRTLYGFVAKTNTPAEPVSKIQLLGSFHTTRFISWSPLPNMLGVGHTSSGGEHG